MMKTIFIFLFGLMVYQNAKAQKVDKSRQDTLLYYMKNSGGYVSSKDSADYFMFIMPPDSSSGLFPVYEYYPNGNIKLSGFSLTKQYYDISFEGACLNYFPNGQKKSRANYIGGRQYGIFVNYFPNGKIYNIENITEQGELQLVECRDSTGKVLAQNGNGKWLKFDKDVQHITETGFVKDSLEEGDWQQIINDSSKYVLVYKHGVPISSTEPGWSANHVYTHVDTEPQFKDGGPSGFNNYLGRTIKFPAVDREQGVHGKVIVTFMVEKDGSISNIQVLRTPSKTMGDEAIRVVKGSPPWLPGVENGQVVRTQYTISFAFSFADGDK